MITEPQVRQRIPLSAAGRAGSAEEPRYRGAVEGCTGRGGDEAGKACFQGTSISYSRYRTRGEGMLRRLGTFLVTIVALVFTANIVCHAQSLSPMTRHMHEVTLNGQARLVGRLPGEQRMRLVLVLPLRNQPGLDHFLTELYDPSSPSYLRFLTVEEFTAMFGPTQEDYDRVIRFAETNGLTVVGTSGNRMNVDVTGSVASIEAAFHLSMVVYQHPTENRTFYAPDREPTPDLAAHLWHIAGLDNYSIPHPLLVHRSLAVKSQVTTGSCPNQTFCGSDMRAAYYGGTLTGSGQSLGLLEFSGTNLTDLNTYYANAGQTNNVPITLLSTDGTSTSCLASQGCDDSEQTLDMTQALGMAPGLSSLVMYVGTTDAAILNAMATHRPLNAQLSSSWTWGPADPSTDEPYFKEFAAQGQSFFQAAGDTGAWGSSTSAYPGDDPYVTTVGGTDLTTSGAGGPWSTETAWADGGGGVSPDNLAIPSWQTAAASGCSGCSTTYRNGPDVSANANPSLYICANQTCPANVYGGTSAAAPMWAGYMALVNQQAIANGHPTLGFINPTLYSIGLSSSYHSAFHDITSGSNGYPATIGYDLATGWGSPNGSGLINALAGSGVTQAWQQVPGALNQVAVGSAGSVWGINSAGQIFSFNTETQSWNQIPGQLAQIAVASDGAVWGINSAQQIFRFNAQTQGWDHIPGALAQIAVGSAGVVWGINASQQIFRFDPGTQGWDQIPGALTQIAVAADGSVWGLNAQQQIYCFDPQTQGWHQIPGSLTQIAMGSAKAVWGLNAQHQVFQFNPQTQGWNQIPGSLTQFTVGANGTLWGIDAAQQIYNYTPQALSWSQIPGTLAQIAVGADGSVWGVNAQQEIFELTGQSLATRTSGQIPGELAQIAVGTDGAVWGLNAAQQIFTFNARTQTWTQVPGSLTQIAVGFGGAIWGINSAQQIFRFNTQRQGWDQIPGALTQIAVGSANAVWGINAQQEIFHYNPQTQGWNRIPGALTQIAVGADGAVWGINPAQQIFTFNPQTQSWNQIPGLLTQIAVGSATAVWGINAAGQVFRYNSQTQGWDQIPGQVAQIAVAYDGTVWGINSAQQIFTFDPQTQAWDQISGLLTQIAVGSEGVVWGVNSSQQIFQFQ
jgi:Tectonin domain/Pro-kumamolisin, activation domain